MNRLAIPFLVIPIFILGGSTGFAKYKIKDLPIKPAQEYDSHQDFQNIVIGAYPGETEVKALELFDTEKLYKRQILPVLVVIENNNEFAIQIHEQDIVLIAQDGTHFPSLPYQVVLLHIVNRPLITYATQPDLLRKLVGKEMTMDYENKAFGERLIGPGGSDFGVIFFSLPKKENMLGARLYLPEITNISDEQQLMFFEFELGRPQQ